MVCFTNAGIGFVSIALGVCLFFAGWIGTTEHVLPGRRPCRSVPNIFEVRDGKFLLYVPGGAAPLEYAASAVKGINVPLPDAAAAEHVAAKYDRARR